MARMPDPENALYFVNPCDILKGKDRIRKDYRYEAFRLADCNLLGERGGIESCTMVEYDSKLWTYGGVDELNRFPGTVMVYDLTRDAWRFGRSVSQPPPRMSHSAVVFKNSMYIFGGYNKKETLNDLWEYSFLSEMWIPWITNKPHPTSRMRHGASVYGNVMTIFGGRRTRKSDPDNPGDMWAIDLARHSVSSPSVWRKVAFQGAVPEDCQGVHTTVGQYIFVWEWNTAVLTKFDYLSRTWSSVMFDEQLAGHFLVSKKLGIFVFGGTVNGCLANELKVWDMKVEDKRCYRFFLCDSEGDEEPPARRNAAGLSVGDSIYAFGGRDEVGRLRDLWRIKTWEADKDGQPVND